MKKIFVLSLFFLVFLSGCNLVGDKNEAKEVTLEEAKVIIADFINEYLMQQGQEVSISEVVKENSLYRASVNVPGGQVTESYLSLDGKTFFPSALDIADVEGEAEASASSQNASQEATLADVSKQKTPKVELFVMSHCPYGTQMEKGILPVLDTLGDKVDFELKFCDYAMHDKKEVDEQIAQYCIQKNEPEKLKEYLYCFLEDADGERCVASVGINKSSLDSCVTATDNEYKITEMYNDRNTWKGGSYPTFPIYEDDAAKYAVSGSPSLVINGTKISSGRDSSTLLRTICAGFENAPSECNTELSAVSPAPGFGFDGSGSATAAECGS